MWMAHQRQGFYGWTVGGTTPQPRWAGRVDVGTACARVADVLEVWWAVMRWPEAPPYSGGVMDAWPNRMAEALAVAKAEWQAVTAYLRHEARPKKEVKQHG